MTETRRDCCPYRPRRRLDGVVVSGVAPQPGTNQPDDDIMWFADHGQDVICTRCLTPGRGWTWEDVIRCEPCHRAVYGDHATDELILSDSTCFGEWWTDEFLDRVGDTREPT